MTKQTAQDLEQRLERVRGLLDTNQFQEANAEITEDLIQNAEPEQLREIYRKIERLNRNEAEIFAASCTSYNKHLKEMDVVKATFYILGEE